MPYVAGSILLIVLDQLIKYFTVKNILPFGEVPFIKGVVSFTFIKNTGAAWGMFAGARWFFAAITVAVLFFLSFYIVKKKIKSPLFNTSMMLIFAGAIGNFIDRLFKGGAVVDMIELKFIKFPVFNFADCCIVIGAVLLCVYILFSTSDTNGE